MIDALGNVFGDYTLRVVALGSAALGIVSGALGSFALLRGQSLLGDAISHAALPGIALAFLLTGSKAPIVLILGAALAGWLGMLCVLAVTGTTRLKQDAALGIVLSVFFGLGLVLLTFIQKLPTAAKAGLDRFLFGQAATLLVRDVVTITVLGAAACICLILLWKELKLLAFDPDFGATMGLPMRGLEITLTALLVVAIVIGLQAVGVVLMSAMVVAPAAAARQWTNRLGVMVLLSGLFGGVAGVGGSIISSSGHSLPTGPLIVLAASAIVVVSLLLAPGRGVLWTWLERQRRRRQLHLDAVLADLYALALQHERPDHAHEAAALEAMRPSLGDPRQSLAALAERELVRPGPGETWALTDAGVREAERVLRELSPVEHGPARSGGPS
jgi:manganese/zinc/iron transport system permease protein